MENFINLRRDKYKIITDVLLFCYFGFIAIPELTRPYFSLQLVLWALALPIVLIALIVTGIRGIAGLWSEKIQNIMPNPKNKYFILLASISILWFVISIVIAQTTYFAYSHKKFDRESWINATGYEGGMFQISERERMLDDLRTNYILGLSKTEIVDLLGEPYELSYDFEMGGKYEGKDLFIYFYKMGMVDPLCLTIVFDEYDIAIATLTSECG